MDRLLSAARLSRHDGCAFAMVLAGRGRVDYAVRFAKKEKPLPRSAQPMLQICVRISGVGAGDGVVLWSPSQKIMLRISANPTTLLVWISGMLAVFSGFFPH